MDIRVNSKTITRIELLWKEFYYINRCSHFYKHYLHLLIINSPEWSIHFIYIYLEKHSFFSPRHTVWTPKSRTQRVPRPPTWPVWKPTPVLSEWPRRCRAGTATLPYRNPGIRSRLPPGHLLMDAMLVSIGIYENFQTSFKKYI